MALPPTGRHVTAPPRTLFLATVTVSVDLCDDRAPHRLLHGDIDTIIDQDVTIAQTLAFVEQRTHEQHAGEWPLARVAARLKSIVPKPR